MKTWVWIAMGLTMLSWLPTKFARACSVVAPGITARVLWPGTDQPIPTNSRFVITYSPGGNGVPAFGPDVALLDADGSPVAVTVAVFGNSVVLRPDGVLLPNHGYQLADRRILPCDTIGVAGCPLAANAQVFASFTTAAGPDNAPPAFAGIAGLGVTNHLTCNSDSCCGTYDVYVEEASWTAGADDVAGADLRYNVYRRSGSSLTQVVALAEGTSAIGAAVCKGDWGAPSFGSGDYVVRAVDWAGNEDSNLATRHLDDPCGSGLSCAVAGSQPTSGRSPWLATAVGMVVAGISVSRRRRR